MFHYLIQRASPPLQTCESVMLYTRLKPLPKLFEGFLDCMLQGKMSFPVQIYPQFAVAVHQG